MNHFRSQIGVTLIELMITLAIVAIIGAFAIPAYTNYTRSARANVCLDEVKNIMLAEEEFINIPTNGNSYFAGTLTGPGNVGTLPGASSGLYIPGNDATENCNYTVVLNGGGTGFTLTVDGTNDLAVEGAGFYTYTK